MARQTDDHAYEGPWDPSRLSPNMASRQVDVSSPRGRDAETGHVRDFANLSNLESPVMQPLSRRPTIESSRRTVSPPNSVKAFANARRRGQDADVHDARPGRRQLGDSNDEKEDTGPEKRTGGGPPHSVNSRLDVPDAQRTSDRVAVVKFLGEMSKRENPRDGLDIDFECLQTLIDSEDRDRFADPDFGNLPDSSIPTVVPMFTSDGDYIDMPSEPVSDSGDKETGAHGRPPPPPRPRTVHQGEQSRFNFFSSALESTIHAAEFGDLVLPEENIRSLFDLPPEGDSDGVWWLNMNSPSASEVWTICKAFGIHPLTIEDIIHKESREKIELFPSYYFACFRSFTVVEEDGETDYHPFNVYVVVFKEGIISFSFTSNLHASRVRFRISQLKEQVSLSSDWICYALIDDIVDSFGPAINQIEHEADAIEDQVFITRVEDNQAFLRKIGYTRKNVMSLMRLLGGKADVLRAFTKRCTEDYEVTPHMDIALYLGDIQDHAVTMMNSLVHFDTMLSRSHSNYLAQLSIDNIDMGNRTNEFLSRVTVIATVIVPLNVICGLFGMNVKVPWGDDQNLNAFFGILGGILAFALLSVILARRFKYL
ncbi:Putative Mg2+ transporter protein, CorA-like/Zinc transport protein ZntB [Colletotrichum destructivum]|uniref:Mg2+ transporter protein, CorA-like/Zinc transport protein ZntB n=1 Tax=Colletotrichum destructivum TaxID=34406 RepID=A0AAX4IS08_9PEZI|nr:Putative Mg2+ transporter protein, CorA-like/Zinc transport protein ZntB [Colletotrichum destructivum]